MVYGLWFMVYGLWFMVYGLWFVDYGLWFMGYSLYIFLNDLTQVLLKNDFMQQLNLAHNNIEGKCGAMLAEGA